MSEVCSECTSTKIVYPMCQKCWSKYDSVWMNDVEKLKAENQELKAIILKAEIPIGTYLPDGQMALLNKIKEIGEDE